MKNFKEFLNENKKYDSQMFIMHLQDGADNMDDDAESEAEFMIALADRIEQTGSKSISQNEIEKLAKKIPRSKKFDGWEDVLDYIISAA